MAAHNTFVSVLVESGLIGFTLYFLFWAVVFRRVLLMPKADRFFWLGVFACYLPIVLTGSMEYQKATWFLGALAFCQGAQHIAACTKNRGIYLAPQASVRPFRPRLS